MSICLELDVPDFYEVTRICLRELNESEYGQIDGLSRSAAALRRLIQLGQTKITIPIGRWERIAAAIEAEADQLDKTINQLANRDSNARTCLPMMRPPFLAVLIMARLLGIEVHPHQLYPVNTTVEACNDSYHTHS